MNSYRVAWHVADVDTSEVDEAGYLYVEATNREDALYLAFDELADQDKIQPGLTLGSVDIKHDTGQWIELLEHQKVWQS